MQVFQVVPGGAPILGAAATNTFLLLDRGRLLRDPQEFLRAVRVSLKTDFSPPSAELAGREQEHRPRDSKTPWTLQGQQLRQRRR